MKNKEENRMFSLYRHTTPSGKVYIGITNQPVNHRWNNGKGYMNVKKGPFKNSIIKYGWSNIKHEILFTMLDKDKAEQLERELIKHYKELNISLNITDGGDGCYGIIPWNKGIKVPYEKSNKRKGCHLTEEHKKKLSKAHKGKATRKGFKLSEEHKAKLRNNHLGIKRTEEEKRKIRENSAFAKKVIEFDLKGNVIQTFNSASEAARKYNIDCSWLAKACRKKVICKGHNFLYQDDLSDIAAFIRKNSKSALQKQIEE